MKTIILILASALFLNGSIVKADTTNLAKYKNNVRRQIVSLLSSANINESGDVTIYFYVYNKSVKVKQVLGSNDELNKKVKERIERYGFTKKGLNGYYALTVKINGGSKNEISHTVKSEFKELMASFHSEVYELALCEANCE